MSTTFTWRIANLERETSDGYVFTAHYTVDAADGTYRAGAYGLIGLERPEGQLVPYSDLTEDQVISWVKNKLGVETVTNVEAALKAQLNEQHQPTKAAGLPWVKKSSVPRNL